MSVPPDAGVLVAEAIGLLLEDCGLDDTLTAEDSVVLVHEVAALRAVPAARTGPIVALLAINLDRGATLVRVRGEVIVDAQLRGLEASRSQVDAAQRILEHAPSTRTIAGLGLLPAEVARLTLHEFDRNYRKVKQASREVRDAWRPVEGWVLPSALTDLDLAAESRALRDGGGLLGRLFGAQSDHARERVKPHLATRHRGIAATEMATVLDHVGAYDEARSSLRAQVATAHPWVQWVVNVDSGKVHERRAASLRWMLTDVEAGNLGAAELALLTDGSWRRVLIRNAAVRWSKALRETRDVPETAGLGTAVAAPLDRFVRWLAKSPSVTPEEFDELTRVLTPALPQIAVALVVAQMALSEPALARRVQAVVARNQGTFGPADENRPRFRAIAEQLREQLDAARSRLEPLRPQHPHLVALVQDLREAQGLMLDDLPDQAPARGPLRVVIAGRTKAGKTTLRKVLTRDLTEDGIGRGAHRTTRATEAFTWDQVTFVDTPGVSAKDDDYDAEVAERACRDADAVVWMFAESLHEEEAQILQALLTVKPVLVVYNAKGRVDNEARLGLFARNPKLTFTDESGHAERSGQMATAAGVRAPLFLAVHASAARRALLVEGETHPAWAASRIADLEAELRRVLSSQARGLRSLRLADQVRTPLLLVGGRAATVFDALSPRCATFEHRIAQEERDLRGAVFRAVDRARATTQKNFASVSAALPGWLEKVDGRGESLDREWSALLTDLDVDTVLSDIAESLASDARASGLLLDREDQLEEKLQRARLGATVRKGIPLLARAWGFLRRLVGLVARNAPRFRKEAAMGPFGWAALAMDVLATTGRALVEDATDSRIDRRAWERNADQAARRELERVRRRVVRELGRIETALHNTVDDHFAQSRTEIARIVESLAATAELEDDAAQAVAEIDRLTVERLLQLGGLPPGQVIAVDRAPNLHLRVKVVGDPEAASRWLSLVLEGCSSEVVTVTSSRHRKHRRPKELHA